MCGIAGYFQLDDPKPPDRRLIGRMINAIRYRGPDELGAYFDDRCVLGHARLSVIDPAGGTQPLCNEDGSIWVVCNGEVYNYPELRAELKKQGHRFRTNSDAEVIVHSYEQFGMDCLGSFNGQFAFAIYDRKKQSLFLARDRMGIRPVFYTSHKGCFYFASEIKSIFCEPSIPRRLDLKALDETFTWWTSAPSRTMFENINELEPGTFLELSDRRVNKQRYWELTFPRQYQYNHPVETYAEELYDLLADAVRLRLRADVPVGAYLSGGLDSSATTALMQHSAQAKIDTFSVTFDNRAFDESSFQQRMAQHLDANHRTVHCTYQSIAESFPEVIRHTESPVLRTAPVPLYILSALVKENGIKVAITGEGADEILGGYDLYKETLIRASWARDPGSSRWPSLLKRLYPTLPISGARARYFLEEFYKSGLDQRDKYYFSHIPRIRTTSTVKNFYTAETRREINNHNSLAAYGERLPESFYDWHHLARAQYLEAKSLLAGYLLSSQGDRVCAGNSVEGRYPFLDHRLVEFAATIPPGYKLFGLKEKYVLKKAMTGKLPTEILSRAKQPFMAPDSNCFVQPDSPDYVRELLSDSSLARTGLFNPVAVAGLVRKSHDMSNRQMSFRDNMSFVGILSTQLVVHHFMDNFTIPDPSPREAFSVWEDHGSTSTGSDQRIASSQTVTPIIETK